jgi:sugar/nucleoside kinase (ribokinase family)
MIPGRQPVGCFIGLCTVDAAYVVDDFPLPNHKVSAQRQELTAGGPATNAAITFAFLGGAASLVSALGR